MSIEFKVYDNGDHTCLIWLPSDLAAIPDCRGFAIERTRNGEKPNYLHGFAAFRTTTSWIRTIRGSFLYSDICGGTMTSG